MENKIKYKLPNGNKIKIIYEDEKIYEIWVKDETGKGWIVLGYDDLMDRIVQAKMYITGMVRSEDDCDYRGIKRRP